MLCYLIYPVDELVYRHRALIPVTDATTGDHISGDVPNSVVQAIDAVVGEVTVHPVSFSDIRFVPRSASAIKAISLDKFIKLIFR